MKKTSYDGYCVGVGVEYPGIVVSAENDKELIRLFKAAVPVHEKALEKVGVKKKEVTVISIDKDRLDE